MTDGCKGDPEKLRKAGVKPLVDLPGVGLNFQDHYLTFATYRAKPDTESFDDFVRGVPEVQKAVFDQWNISGTGPLATNGIEAGVKIRPTEEELKQMDTYPTSDFRSGWDSYFKNKPDKPVGRARGDVLAFSLFTSISSLLLMCDTRTIPASLLLGEGILFTRKRLTFGTGHALLSHCWLVR